MVAVRPSFARYGKVTDTSVFLYCSAERIIHFPLTPPYFSRVQLKLAIELESKKQNNKVSKYYSYSQQHEIW